MADFPVITSVTAVQADQFLAQSGTTVTATTNVGAVLGIYVNGIAQRKTTDWSIAGQVVTFVSTLVSDDVILVYTTSQATLNGNVSIVHQEFASASGTSVTLNQTSIGGVVLVARNGVVQRETTDYTINYSTGVITFTTTLSSEQVTVAYISGGGGVGNATTLGGFAAVAAPTTAAVPVTDVNGRLTLNSQYSLIKRTIILNGTTSYTPTTGVRALLVQCQAAGGGGGGANGGGNCSAGGGGGSGGYSESFINSIPASPITVAVGAGGAAGVANTSNGTAGGDTSFNSGAVLAHGGSGANNGITVAGPTVAGQPGNGGVVGVGDIAVVGTTGGLAIALASASSAISGFGGQPPGPIAGHGGAMANSGAGAGAPGVNGGGGGGGVTQGAGAAQNGGAGGNGIMLIWEFE